MNYGELKAYIREYVNRSDLSDDLFDVWRVSCNQRLQRDANIVYLDRAVTVANPTGDTVFPVDLTTFQFLNYIVSVAISGSSTADGQPVALAQVSWETYEQVKAAGVRDGITQPSCYVPFSTGFKVAPGDQADFSFDVIFSAGDTAMASDTSANYMLTFAQPMVIECYLIDVYNYLRDVEGAALARERYAAEVAAFRTYFDWQKAGPNILAKGAWSWV